MAEGAATSGVDAPSHEDRALADVDADADADTERDDIDGLLESVQGGRGEKGTVEAGDRPVAPPPAAKVLRPSVVARGGTVTGALDRAEIDAVFRARTDVLMYCYQKGLRYNPRLGGVMTVLFTVGSRGRVESASVADSTLRSPDVESCVVSKVRRLEFPAPADGRTVDVRRPVVFSPGG